MKVTRDKSSMMIRFCVTKVLATPIVRMALENRKTITQPVNDNHDFQSSVTEISGEIDTSSVFVVLRLYTSECWLP